MQQTASLPRPSDRWIPWYFVLFFIVLMLVLGTMAFLAVHTHPGVVTENAYDKGLAYNKIIQNEAQQDSWGWKSDLSVTPLGAPHQVKADFVLMDVSGKQIKATRVKLWLVRPTQQGMDQTVDLALQKDGNFTATLTLPAQGLWEARIAVQAQDKNYQMTKRIVVP